MKYDYEIKNDKLLREAYTAGRRQGYQQLDERGIIRAIKSFLGRGGRGLNNIIGGTPVPPTSIRPANWTGLNAGGEALMNAYSKFLKILRRMGMELTPGDLLYEIASSLGSFLANPNASSLNSLNNVMKEYGLQLIPGPEGVMVWADLNGNVANLAMLSPDNPNTGWMTQMITIFYNHPMENF